MTIPRALVGGAVAALAVLTGGCAATQEPVEAPGWSVAELVAQVDAVAAPQVRWTPCAEQVVPDTECAAIEVPLDYTDPNGRQLALAVVRQPARDPERRIGTLFTAAGGPGGSGVDWAARGEMFPGELGDRFDVVTFDQRGIGGSSGVRCFPDRVRALQLSSLLDPVSYTSDTLAGIHATAVGTGEVFGEFLRLCAGARACALGAGGAPADELGARDTALLDRAKTAAIPVGAEPETVSVGYGELVQAHAMPLYDPATGWPALAVLLAELERGSAGSPAVVREILSAVATTGDFLDLFVAISCADNTLPRRPDLRPELAAESATSAPLFGPFWLYLRRPCAVWPAPGPGYPQRR
ncbi:hypothetical protein [Nocardia rhizosphaerae]|uniref:Alpha/beta hydrolase family protein n=1 Tax=Nocardia rhizosphaerae TaxID=1691571 RepID=A0ABV8KZQ1_9NOCA